ncbi:MAG: CHAT domain-containing protein [Caldilineaceae bacterium]|nr:CHAT domain-containing protein [Caldilineaceae bacterium]
MSESIYELDPLIDDLLSRPPAARPDWLAIHENVLGMPLIEALKQRTDQYKQTDPQLAKAASALALWLAQFLPGEPFAHPLACWARGNWALLHEPQEALNCYRQALTAYQQAGALQETVRLLSNLIGAAYQCSKPDEGFAAYESVQHLLPNLAPEDEWYLIVLYQNYGLLLHEAGRHTEALSIHRKVHELGEKHKLIEKIWEADVNYTQTLYELGRFEEAEGILYRCRELATAHRHWITVARIEMNLGELYTAQGKPGKALHFLQSARNQFTRIENPMEVASVILREAELFERLGALAESRRAYDAALSAFTERDMKSQMGRVLVQASVVARRSGDFRRATQWLAQAAQLWKDQRQPTWQARVLLEDVLLALAQSKSTQADAMLQQWPSLVAIENPGLQANFALVKGILAAQRFERSTDKPTQQQATEWFDRAATYARQEKDRFLLRQALVGLGRLMRADLPEQARIWLEEAAALDEEVRRSLSVEELKAGFLTQTDDLYPLLIEIALVADNLQQALQWAWRSKSGALFDLLLEEEFDQRSDDVSAQIQALRNELTQARLLARTPKDTPYPEPLSSPQNERIRQTEARLSEARRQRNRTHQTRTLDNLTLEGVLQQTEADCLLEYVRCGNQILSFAVERTGNLRVVCSTNLSPLHDLIEEIRLAFHYMVELDAEQRVDQCNASLDECLPLLHHLYKMLIEPLLGTQIPRRLLIAPCDPLHQLPFAALWNGSSHLVEVCELELTPTAALLGQRLPSSGMSPPLILGSTLQGRLPAVADEAASIMRLFPDSHSWVDQPNITAQLYGLTQSPRILHIATHTVSQHDAPIFSALHLGDDLLTVEQCFELPLDATELVVLNACSTAAGLETGGTLLAFQSAFFAAGARRVLSTLWPVGDEPAARWMADFYTELTAGHPPSVSVDRVQRKWIKKPVQCHPALWSAFVCSRR